MAPTRLSADLVELVRHLVSPLDEVTRAALRAQAEQASYRRFSATMLDLEVPAGVGGIGLGDGPAPVSAFVYDGAGLVSEILVWIKGGMLIGLEQAWFEDPAPTSWPHPPQVVVS